MRVGGVIRDRLIRDVRGSRRRSPSLGIESLDLGDSILLKGGLLLEVLGEVPSIFWICDFDVFGS